jgi:hypothetical protein
MPATSSQAEKQLDATQDLIAGQQSTKFDETHLKGPVKKAIENGTLEAIRQGLYEYWMYSKLDPNAAATMGYGAKDMVNLVNQAVTDRAPVTLTPKPNAVGGTVLQPPPGEVLASVAPGETIVPKGGFSGGSGRATNISITVNGIGGQDLANYLKEKVNQGIYEYKRREKFH